MGWVEKSPTEASLIFYKWGQEAALKINYVGPLAPDVEFYETGEEDTHKFGVIFNKKPDSNVVHFTMEGHEDLDFFFQPALANVDENGDSWELNDSKSKDFRPANVIGSYAVYHKTKKGHLLGEENYGTGKAFHIFRPKFIDAQGKWVWGSLRILEGKYDLLCPQEFLDSAVYPVRSNDTFGNTAVGASNSLYGYGYPQCVIANSMPGSNGSMTSISIYGKDDGSHPFFNTALYADSAGTPGGRLASISGGVGGTFSGTAGWVTTNLSYSGIVSGTQYWLGFKSDSTSTGFYAYYDTGGSSLYWIGTNTWPDPYGGTSGTARIISIYATFTSTSSSSSCSCSSSSSSCRSSSSSSSSSLSSSSSSSSSRSSSSSSSKSSSSSSYSSIVSSSSSCRSSSSSSCSSSSSSRSSSSRSSSSSSCRSSSSSSSSKSSSSSYSSSSSASVATAISYTRAAVTSLPADDTDLGTAYTNPEYIDVSAIDNIFVVQSATGGYSVHQFKYTHTSQHAFSISVVAKSDRPTSISPAYLEIYNRTTALWEQLAQNATSPAGASFLLSGIKNVNLGDYFDGSNMLSARVWQRVQ